MTDLWATLTEFVLRRRRGLAAVWLVATLAGGWAAATLTGHLSQRFVAPGRPAFAANAAILRLTHAGGVIAPFVLLGDRRDESELRRLALSVPRERSIVGGPGLEGRGGRIAELVFPEPGRPAPDENDAALAALSHHAQRSGVRVTGQQPLADGSSPGGAGLLLETLFGGLGALIVLALVFGSALALVPIVLAVVSILTTFLILRGLAAGFTISFVVQFLVGLIGLGVSIDYSLLMVVRWREERDRGADPSDAARRAMATAGRSILVSGTTVGIGLIVLVVVPVPFIRSIGVGGLLIPVISVLATLTLLPGTLASLGPRLDRRRDRRRARTVDESPGLTGGAWRSWAIWVVRRRWIAAGAGLATMVALALFATALNPGLPSVSALTASGPAKRALTELTDSGISAGVLSPIEVLIPGTELDRARSRLAAVRGVRAVRSPRGHGFVIGGERLLEVLPAHDPATRAGRRTLNAIRALHSSRVLVGGVNAADSDLTNAIYSSFPLMTAVIALLTFLLLALALRSVVLPLKAIALNVLSIAAAYGVVVLIWQDGHGSQLIGSVPGTGAITNWVPLAMFGFLFGLSMDYEVFILSRIREAYDHTPSTRDAVITGLTRTGRLVTSAALILVLAFVALGAAPGTQIRILATGLAVGIALDATVVRGCIVPALITLLGDANWWWPRRRTPTATPTPGRS